MDSMTAREKAADAYGPRGQSYVRDVFTEGWDAAMRYVNDKLSEGVGHLDSEEEVGYPHFSDGGMPLG